MEVKKGLRCISVLIFILIAIIPIGYAQWTAEGLGGDDEKQTPAQQAQDAISNGGDYTGSVPANTQIRIPGGGSATVSGNVNIVGGKIKSADSISYGGASVNGATDFEASRDGYSVGSAKELRQGGSIIKNGQGITYSGDKLTATKYDSFTVASTFTTNGENLDAESNVISVSKADNLISDTVSFTDITDTSFSIHGDAVEAKPSLNINLTIKDASGNEVIFESLFNDSSVIVSKMSPSLIIIEKGILTCNYGNKKDSLLSNSTAMVRMGDLCFECMQIKPIGTYWYAENFTKDFGVNIPQNSGEYKLCLRKVGNENITFYDGLVDFINKEMVLGKIVNYLRNNFQGLSLFSLLFETIYQSLNRNTVVMNLDDDFIYIDRFEILPDLEGNISITRNSHFEIIENVDKRLLKISNSLYPNVIHEYSTSNIDNVIWFNQTDVGTVLSQATPANNSYVIAYPPTIGTKQHFKEIMKRSYAERNLENEI